MPARNPPNSPVLECRFFRTAAGREPVREWLKSLPAAVRVEIGSDIQSVQWRWPVGMPLVDGFGAGLYEVRTRIDGDIFRVLFCLHRSTMILLHGFQKKTRTTLNSDQALARRRMRELGKVS